MCKNDGNESNLILSKNHPTFFQTTAIQEQILFNETRAICSSGYKIFMTLKSLHEITNHLQVIPVYKVWQQNQDFVVRLCNQQNQDPCRKASLL